jgi:hypothetical protein
MGEGRGGEGLGGETETMGGWLASETRCRVRVFCCGDLF